MATMDIKLYVSAKTKHDAEELFRSMGMKSSSVIKTFLEQFIAGEKFMPLACDRERAKAKAFEDYHRNLPISKNVPNAETIRSLQDYKDGKYTSYTFEEFCDYLESVEQECSRSR
jgi:addiction module RelB/DinJ family antitoxin